MMGDLAKMFGTYIVIGGGMIVLAFWLDMRSVSPFLFLYSPLVAFLVWAAIFDR